MVEGRVALKLNHIAATEGRKPLCMCSLLL